MESCFYESILRREETGVPGGNPRSQVEKIRLNPHTTFVVEVERVIEVHDASLTSQRVQHRVFYLDGHPSRYQPRPTGLNFGEQTDQMKNKDHVL